MRGQDFQNIVRAAVNIAREYPQWCESLRKSKKLVSKLPPGIGVGLDAGDALRITHENGSFDYIGQCINYAAKFQHEARSDRVGGAVISDGIWQELDSDLKSFFGDLERYEVSAGTTLLIRRLRIDHDAKPHE